MKVYKIRHIATGKLYSKKTPNTSRPYNLTYHAVGKTWSKLGWAKVTMEAYEELVNECEIVEYNVTEHCTHQPWVKEKGCPIVWISSEGP